MGNAFPKAIWGGGCAEWLWRWDMLNRRQIKGFKGRRRFKGQGAGGCLHTLQILLELGLGVALDAQCGRRVACRQDCTKSEPISDCLWVEHASILSCMDVIVLSWHGRDFPTLLPTQTRDVLINSMHPLTARLQLCKYACVCVWFAD